MVGANVGLSNHSKGGWGYAGPDGWGRPAGERIYVDSSRLLPEPEQEPSRLKSAAERRQFAELEGRLRRFGYTFHEPFVTGWCARRNASHLPGGGSHGT